MEYISQASVEVPKQSFLNVVECLIDERIGRGKFIPELEKRFEDYFGVKYAILVANGTLADMIAMSALKIMNPGANEVIVPAFTFPAQINAVMYSGLRPVFVDVGEDYQIDIESVKENINSKTLCVFPAHLLGKESLCAKEVFEINGRKIPIVEDTCEGMGGDYADGGKLGTHGLCGTYSMYASHIISTGEGGLIVTDDPALNIIARSIVDHGKTGNDFDFEYIGLNAKITNMQAAIGCGLVDKIDSLLETRRENVKFYNDILGLDFEATAPHCYPVIYGTKNERDTALNALQNQKIECRKLMANVPWTKPYFTSFLINHELKNAVHFSSCGLLVPCHQHLTEEHKERIANAIIRP